MQVVTIEDDNGTLALTLGEEVEVRLPENAGTGYLWHLDLLDPPLRVVEEAVKPALGQAGATGEHWFRLHAERSGDTTVEAKLVRPWATDSVARRFRLAVRVR